jgi:hypothetical protein
MTKKNTISADEIYDALTKEDGDVVYKLSDKTITGKLDLTYHSINKAVYIQNCEFLDDVNLTYCEFKQPVCFSGTRFEKSFICYGAVFNGNLECDGAVFKGGARFAGVKCNGNGLFRETRFANEEIIIDFLCATFKSDLDCDGAVFEGGTMFQCVKCSGNVLFRGTRFKSKEQLVDFLNSNFNGNLDCDGAVFEGGARFQGVKCSNNGYFRDVQFKNKEKLVDFLNATFEGDLYCDRAIFKGGIQCAGIKCNGNGRFQDTQFENEEKIVEFLNATFMGNLYCDRAIFKGEVRFQGMKCTGHCLFRDAQFENDKKLLDFSFASFGANLEFKNNIFRLNLDFNGTSIERLNLENISYTKDGKDSDKKIDLRDSFIRNFIGENKDNLKFVEAQRPDCFSQEPYIQLEKYYLRTGDEIEAQRVYLRGRDAVRGNATKHGTKIHWPWTKIVFDWFLNLSVRYGTQTRRLLIPIIVLLLVGFYIYRGDDALVLKDKNTETAQFREKVIYLVDLIVPVNLRIAEKWQPKCFTGEIYALCLIIFGWLLIPLLVTSAGGLLRRQ